MKHLFFISALFLLASCASLNKSAEPISGVYTVSCGKCNFEMTGDACDLAIEVEGNYYYVEGTGLHDHGDAHADDGLCSVKRKAKVTGEIKKGVFVSTSFELIPVEAK